MVVHLNGVIMAKELETIMTVEQAIEIAKLECKDPYALQYLNSMDRARAEGGQHGVDVQIMYAVSNMSYWRGDTARAVKKVLRAHSA
jgi:hypothetical protein